MADWNLQCSGDMSKHSRLRRNRCVLGSTNTCCAYDSRLLHVHVSASIFIKLLGKLALIWCQQVILIAWTILRFIYDLMMTCSLITSCWLLTVCALVCSCDRASAFAFVLILHLLNPCQVMRSSWSWHCVRPRVQQLQWEGDKVIN